MSELTRYCRQNLLKDAYVLIPRIFEYVSVTWHRKVKVTNKLILGKETVLELSWWFQCNQKGIVEGERVRDLKMLWLALKKVEEP